MIPGPYAICFVEFEENSDAGTYRILRWGYDSAADAFKDVATVASEKKVAEDRCTVIRQVDREEAGRFMD
jgi:hypothetical protein